MATYWFNAGVEAVFEKTLDWANDTIKVRLVTTLPAITATSMTGVTGVGTDQTLGTKSVVKDDTNHQVKFVAGRPTFPAVVSGYTLAGAVVFKYGTGDADSVPLCAADLDGLPTNGGGIELAFPTVMGQANVVSVLSLTGSERWVPITWDAITNATRYVLRVGTSTGSYGLFSSDVGFVRDYSLLLVPGTYYAQVEAYAGDTSLDISDEQVVVVA